MTLAFLGCDQPAEGSLRSHLRNFNIEMVVPRATNQAKDAAPPPLPEQDMLLTETDASEIRVALRRFLQTAHTPNRELLLELTPLDAPIRRDGRNQWSFSSWSLLQQGDGDILAAMSWKWTKNALVIMFWEVRVTKEHDGWVAKDLSERRALLAPRGSSPGPGWGTR
jgi:hypothetical protein